MPVFHCRVALLAASVPIVLAMSACTAPPVAQAPAAPAAAPAPSPAERGKMLVIGGGCHDCHTTKKLGANGPEPDMSMRMGGRPESIKVAPPYRTAPGSQWAIGITDTLTAWSGAWG